MSGEAMPRMDAVVEYLQKSKRRLAVLEAVGRSISTTNKVAARTKLHVSTARSIIGDLNRKGLVTLAANKTRRPMIYRITKLGETALRMRDASGSLKWKGSGKQRRIARRVSTK